VTWLDWEGSAPAVVLTLQGGEWQVPSALSTLEAWVVMLVAVGSDLFVREQI